MTEAMQEPVEDLKFEEAMDRLERLVQEMESGALPLEEMMARFEEGAKLSRLCRARLDALQKRIEILTSDDGQDGQWAAFEPDSSRGAANAPF